MFGCHQQNRNRIDSNHSATSLMTTSSCASTMISTSPSSTPLYHSALATESITDNNMMMNRGRRRVSLPSTSKSSFSAPNVMQWMQKDCPKDLVPLILAFAGPQKVAAIGKTNRFWYQVMDQEETWSRLCECLYKWREGDNIPQSWKKHYLYNPCVPVDYSSIRTAIRKVTSYAKRDLSRPSEVRILLRSGRYNLRKAISMDDEHDNINHAVPVTIETMTTAPGIYQKGDVGFHSDSQVPSDRSRKKLKTSIRNIFRCRTVDVEDEDDENFAFSDSFDEYLDDSLQSSIEVDSATSDEIEMKSATLVLKTRRHNEPLIRIAQGSFTLRNINLVHGSSGMDIWNGNSAIQIQPHVSESFHMATPTVTLDGVNVTSWSGRGVVNVDGGDLKIRNSYIHDCAATGIYVGGTGSRAIIEHSDVIHNGRGNRRNRRGISAGHSGIYLEQGHASITDCNISRNTLTGISAISPDNAILTLEESDLFSNGTFQLEMPAFGSVAFRNSVTTNNTLASSGEGRSRSILFERVER